MSEFPYPGLRPFERHETDIFFGREEHTDQLIDKLGVSHFIAVVGPSGCGKSSLVRTGLLADLERGFLASAGVSWRIAELRPGNQPVVRLTQALLAASALRSEYLSHFTDDSEAPAFLRASLCRGPLGLHEILRDTPLPPQTSLLILVDQFEEIFRYYRQGEANEAAAFVELLLTSSQHPAIYIVITMRSDFLGDCALFYGLPEAINQGLFLTPRLTREQLRVAIEGPAQVFGGQLEPVLVNRLLNDLGTDPDQLPLLQHALMRMWHLATRDQSPPIRLTTQHYETIGTLTRALSQHAEEIYAELSPVQQSPIAEMLFRSLTERGSGHGDTRRPVKLSEVATLANVPCQQVVTVVEIFRQPGRSFLTPPEIALEPETILDITHESLIRKWQRLKEWTKTEARLAAWYKRLEDTANRWHQGQAALWRNPELTEALAWQQEAKPTMHWAKRYGQHFDLAMKFLVASIAQQQQEQHHQEVAKQQEWQRQRTRRIARIALLALVVVSGLALLEFWQVQKERDLRQLATTAQQEAVVAQRAAETAKQVAEDAKQEAEVTKEERTTDLFEFQLTHASLLAQVENYAAAQQVLQDSHKLDSEIPNPRRHARNILTWFTHLMGTGPQQIYELTGTPSSLFSVAISPDGKILAAGGENDTVVLFDVNTGTLLRQFTGHHHTVRAVAFDPHGQWLASAGDETKEGAKIILWQLATGQLWQEWTAPAAVKALAINREGTQLVSGGEDRDITFWSVATGKVIKVLKGHTESIAEGGLAFHPTQPWLASASYDKTARIWDLTTDKTRYVLEHTDDVANVIFSPNGEQLATSSDDKNVRLWDSQSGQLLRILQGHKNRVFGLRFVQGGKYLVSASLDRTLRLWETATGNTLRIFQGHTAGIIHLDNYGDQIFSAGYDGKVMRWETTLPDRQLIDLPATPLSTAIAPPGSPIAIGLDNGTLCLYWPTTDQLKCDPTAHQKQILHLAFSPDSHFLASASFDETAKLWQVSSTGLQLQQTLPHPAKVRAISFSPLGNLLATGANDGQIGVFQLDAQSKSSFQSPIFYQAHTGQVNSVEIDATGNYLLSGGADGYTRLWRLNELPPKRPLYESKPAKDEILWAAISPDQQRFACVGRELSAYVYATHTGKQEHRLVGHEQTIFRAIFSPDSQQLVTVSGDGTVRWWDLDTGSELFTLRLPTQPGPKPPLWDFDFRCTPQDCWIAVPLTRDTGKLMLYHLGATETIYD